MWNLPRSGIELVSPTFAGRSLSTVPAEKSQEDMVLKRRSGFGKEEQEKYFGHFRCDRGKKIKAASLWEISKVSQISDEEDVQGILREEAET